MIIYINDCLSISFSECKNIYLLPPSIVPSRINLRYTVILTLCSSQKAFYLISYKSLQDKICNY